MPRKKSLSQFPPQTSYTLPHSVEGEQGVLGSMLISPKTTIPEVVDKINEEYFYIPAHQTIYSVMVEEWGKGSEIDLITFTQILRDKNILDTVGGAAIITNLFSFVPAASNIGYYLEIIREKHILRQIIGAATEVVRKAYEEQDEVNLLLDEAQSKILEIGKDRFKSKPSLNEDLLAKLDRMENGEPDADVIKTWIRRLDEISPLKNGDMPIIVGERKAGKSILSLTLLENICISQRKPGLYFSLESPRSEVMDRIFAGVSRIPFERHHLKRMIGDDLDKSQVAIQKIQQSNLIVYDDVYDLTGIVAVAKQEKIKNPELAVVVVDYAQLVRTISKKGGNREQEVATVSRTLRLLAMEIKTALLLLSQLNVDGAARESKALEQDCTACWKIANGDEPGEKMIHIPYQRNGPSGESFPVSFLGNIARVENMARDGK